MREGHRYTTVLLSPEYDPRNRKGGNRWGQTVDGRPSMGQTAGQNVQNSAIESIGVVSCHLDSAEPLFGTDIELCESLRNFYALISFMWRFRVLGTHREKVFLTVDF